MNFYHILCCLSFFTGINSTVTKAETEKVVAATPSQNVQPEILDKNKADDKAEDKTSAKQEPISTDDSFVLAKTKLDNISARLEKCTGQKATNVFLNWLYCPILLVVINVGCYFGTKYFQKIPDSLSNE